MLTSLEAKGSKTEKYENLKNFKLLGCKIVKFQNFSNNKTYQSQNLKNSRTDTAKN